MNDCLNELKELIFNETQDQDLSSRIMRQIKKQFAGEAIYIAKDIAQRNREIAYRYTYSNRRSLCREYGIGSRQLQKIISSLITV